MLLAVFEVRAEPKLLLRLRGGARGVSLSAELHIHVHSCHQGLCV